MSFQIPICPITHIPIKDPVICPDGHTYEKEAIEQWLSNSNKSPMNPSKIIYLEDIVPNYALREIIYTHQTIRSPSSNELTREEAELNSLSMAKSAESLLQRRDLLDESSREDNISIRAVQDNLQVVEGNNTFNDSSRDRRDTKPSIHIGTRNNSAVVFIENPDLAKRIPRDIVCVIDISGSMGVDVSIKTSQGQGEDHGLSILDVVKHAATTVAAALNSHDRLGIVTFDENSYIHMDLTYMSTVGQDTAKENINYIRTGGSTNLHAGISKALDMIGNSSCNRESSVLVFTDGVPNRRPSRGEDYELKKYKDINSYCPTVHMFGFSNNLMISLMYDLSRIGNGMFCYIPDASFVGTIFVNALSNILSTYADNATLTVGSDHYELGSLQYGQSKSVVLHDKEFLNNEEISLFYNQNKQLRTISTSTSDSVHVLDIDKINDALVRDYFIQCVEYCIKQCKTNQYDIISNNIQNVICLINNTISSSSSSCTYSKDLIEDLSIQISQSLSKEYFNTWGKHFVHSILRAHQIQYCNNFKDPGVQHYGGTFFHQLQDSIDTLFNDIPPPTPSNITEDSVPVQSMSYYNDNSNPCFAGWSIAELNNGCKVRIDELVSGDIVKTVDGWSSIVCIVKTHCRNKRANLVLLDNGMAVTAYHPIFYDAHRTSSSREYGSWVYPKDIVQPVWVSCQAVYSFVLERDHRILINDIPCICFGHGFTNDPVLEHHYYGTQAVIEDLKCMNGWDKGLVELRSGCIKADNNGMVEGLVYNYNEQCKVSIETVC